LTRVKAISAQVQQKEVNDENTGRSWPRETKYEDHRKGENMLDNDYQLAAPLFKRRVIHREMLLTTGGALPEEEGREVRACLGDGVGFDEWFWGSAPGTSPSSPPMRGSRSNDNLAAERIGSEVST
jgi:hypothetical protein